MPLHISRCATAVKFVCTISSLIQIINIVKVIREVHITPPNNIIATQPGSRPQFELHTTVSHLSHIKLLSSRAVYGRNTHAHNQVAAFLVVKINLSKELTAPHRKIESQVNRPRLLPP